MLAEIREKVIASFNKDNCSFSNMSPYEINGFIDCKYMLCILMVACNNVGDDEIRDLCFNSLSNLALVGDDARAYASEPASGTWKVSRTMAKLFYKEKPQASAGNMMAQYACKNGITVEVKSNKTKLAKILCLVAPVYGYAIRYISKLRQHINTFMLAHLLLGMKPPRSMQFLAKDNMIYSYLYRIPCRTLYQNTGIWSAKDYPGESKIKDKNYSPICNLVGIYLQETLLDIS